MYEEYVETMNLSDSPDHNTAKRALAEYLLAGCCAPFDHLYMEERKVRRKRSKVGPRMTSFFGKKPKEENGSKFPGWGKAKPPEDDDPTLDDLRAKARARQENTANDEAIARSLEEED